jgi:hypothetical protein
MTGAAPHIVLLGDSIFDNSSYTGGEPDVETGVDIDPAMDRFHDLVTGRALRMADADATRGQSAS